MVNKLTYLYDSGRKDKNYLKYAIYLCDCGNLKEIRKDKVKSGSTKACGCLLKTHGMSYSKTYSSWACAKSRCLNKNDTGYEEYGGRGITMDDGWAASFKAFLADMGEVPEGMTIDRIDSNGDYTKENCRWATTKEQGQNKRTSYYWHIKGIDFDSCQEAANHFGVSTAAIQHWAGGVKNGKGGYYPATDDCYKTPRYQKAGLV